MTTYSCGAGNKTTTDMLGRTVMEERSGYGGTNVTTYTFNSLGRMQKTDTTGVVTTYEYDSDGRLIAQQRTRNLKGTKTHPRVSR